MKKKSWNFGLIFILSHIAVVPYSIWIWVKMRILKIKFYLKFSIKKQYIFYVSNYVTMSNIKRSHFFTYIFVLLDFSNNFNFDSIWKWVWNIFLKNNNFHYEGVKRGTFGYTLGIWEVKWHLNLLWNICRHLPQLCYIIIMIFYIAIWLNI